MTRDDPLLSSAALRMRRHRDRQRSGLRCVTVELGHSQVEVLGAIGLLKNTEHDDREAVRDALQGYIDVALKAT